MFPLYDESAPKTKKPFLTIGLILINVLIFLITAFGPDFEQIVYEWGLIPARILEREGFLTFLSSMFLHAGLLHLVGNMWFLWIFADNLEHSLGTFRFLIFYVLTGIVASLVHIFTISSLETFLPVIGASGAISGILGGYAVLFPQNKIRAFMIGYFRPYLFSVSAWLYALIWFFYQLLYAATPTSIAYMAHIGGFISGMILIFPFKEKLKRKDHHA